MEKRGENMALLDDVIGMLLQGVTLPEKYRDHWLAGDYKGFRECHVKPDWLLIYRIEKNILALTFLRTGTHSDLNF
jgi:mRNA interferase YafQ